MVYLLAFVSTMAVGGLFALAAELVGVERADLLVAIAIVGAGLQSLALLVWYLVYTRRKAQKYVHLRAPDK